MESSSSSLLLLLHPPHPPPPRPPWRFPFSLLISHCSQTPFLFLPLRRSLAPIRARKFDFGPRSYDDDDGNFGDGSFDRRRRERRRSKQRRRRWFDERERRELDEREPSMLDQVVDSLWFLKVLRSYGWFLPAIMASLLLATGPKAFLMAFSLPLGLSLLILAFKKLSVWLEGSPDPKRRRKTESPFGKGKPFSTEEVNEEEEEEDNEAEEEEDESRPGRTQKSRYRSWATSNNGSVHKGSSGSKFRGWDELIREEEETGRASQPDQQTDEQVSPTQEAMSDMPRRERELPLLLKLLVALFPFLGSWTSLL